MRILPVSFADESNDADWLMVAGYVASAVIWEPFEQDWRRLLAKWDLPEFHMKPCFQGECPFQSVGDFDERMDIAEEFASLISRTHLFGQIVAIDLHALAEIRERWQLVRKKLGPGGWDVSDPYYLAFQIFVQSVADQTPALLPGEGLEFVFDCKPGFDGNAVDIFSQMKASGNWPPKNPLRGVSHRDSAEYPGLQAADILAWAARREIPGSSGDSYRSKRAKRVLDLAMSVAGGQNSVWSKEILTGLLEDMEKQLATQ